MTNNDQSFILLFPGQGSQVVGMGQAWYQASPTVRDYFHCADRILQKEFGFQEPLMKICCQGSDARLQETRVCQPALFVLGYAMVEHLKRIGAFERYALVGATGISLGELTAWACAGVWDFEVAVRIIAERGRLMQGACDAQPTGMMALIGGTDAAIAQLCADFDLDVSNRNCPGQVVVSGLKTQLEKAHVAAKEHRFKLAVPLKVAGAYHSRWMQPAREAFECFIKEIPFRSPQFPVISNTTGQTIEDVEAIRRALVIQLTQTVLVEQCLRTCIDDLHATVGLECGPGNVIAGLAKRTSPQWVVKSAAEPTVCEAFQ